MATERQIEANRRNAARSTGPRTDEGKQASRLNAIKHGLLADTAFVPSLDKEEEWKQFRADLLESLQAEGGLESLLAERVIAGAWRLARVGRYERDEITKEIEKQQARKDLEARYAGRLALQGGLAEIAKAAVAGSDTRLPQLPELATLAQIARYEGHLHRQLMQCLHELQRVQARRAGTTDGVPAAVDVVLSDGAIPTASET